MSVPGASSTSSVGVRHPNPTFGTWVRNTPALLITQVVTVLGLFASASYYVIHVLSPGLIGLSPEYLIEINAYLHIPLLLFAALYLAYHLDSNEEGRTRTGFLWDRLFAGRVPWVKASVPKGRNRLVPTAQLAVRSFKIYFLAFIVFMLLYYTWTLLSGSHELDCCESTKVDTSWSELARVAGGAYMDYVLNMAGGLALLGCFIQVWRPREIFWPLRRARSGPAFIVLCLLLCLAPVLGVQHYLLHFKPTMGALQDYRDIMNWICGLFNAVVMMVFMSRLDSKLIGLQSWLIGLLYAYAAVQTLFAVFPEEAMQEVKALTLYAVLFLKVYFFFIVHFALSQGRIFCYMVCAPLMREACDRRQAYEMRILDRRSRMKIQALRRTRTVGPIFKAVWRQAVDWVVHNFMFLFPLSLLLITLAVLHLQTGNVAADSKWSLSDKTVEKIHVWLILVAWLLFWSSRKSNLEAITKQVVKAYRRWKRIRPEARIWPKAPARRLRDPDTIYRSEVGPAIDNINYWFRWFLLSLLGFYLFEWLVSIDPPKNGFLGAGAARLIMVEVFLNNLSGLFLFICFLELVRPRTRQRYVVLRDRQRRFAWMVFIGFTVLQVIVAASWSTDSASKHWIDESSLLMWKTVSGILVSIAFALFLSRFDGVQMWQNPLEIRFLMVYAAMQPLLVIFGISDGVYLQIKEMTVAQALILKLWLFAVVWRAMYRGGMAHYLLTFAEIDDMADRVFRHGLLLRLARHGGGHNSLEVYEAGRLVFSADGQADGMVTFKSAVESVISSGKSLRNYTKGSVNGAWRVQLNCASGPQLLGRYDFISEDQADEFIKRTCSSIEFIKATYR